MYETHDKRALLLPNVTPADAGKVLAVDENGKLSLEEIGSGLPEVDSTDAGMVLTVSENGEWEAAEPSGASDFVVHISFDETTGFSVTETFDEMQSALEAGKYVYGIFVFEDTMHLKLDSYNNSEIKLSANPVMYESGGNHADAISIDYFIVKLDDVTGDTVVEFEQFYGELADKPTTIYLEKNLSDELRFSYTNIVDAVSNGKSVCYSVSGLYSRKILPLIGYDYDSTPGAEKYLAFFGGVDPDTSNISIVTAQASTASAKLVVS